MVHYELMPQWNADMNANVHENGYEISDEVE